LGSKDRVLFGSTLVQVTEIPTDLQNENAEKEGAEREGLLQDAERARTHTSVIARAREREIERATLRLKGRVVHWASR